MGLIPSVNNGGSVIFVDYGNTAKVFKALLRRYDKAVRTVVSFWVSNSDLLSINAGVSLASSNSHNHLILALVAVSSA